MDLKMDLDDSARPAGTLWAAAVGDRSSNRNAPAKAEAVAAFESDFGVRLPPHHREFLLRANGAAIGSFRYAELDSLRWNLTKWLPAWGGTAEGPILPFARDWGGDYFGYDLRHPTPEGDYPVLRWNHAAADRNDPQAKIWSEYAPDFLGFLAEGLDKPVKVPAIVMHEREVEYVFDGTRRCVIEWEQVHEVAVEVVFDEDYEYCEPFWKLTGPGVEFRAPVGLVAGAEQFESRVLALPGFDLPAYQRASGAKSLWTLYPELASPPDPLKGCWLTETWRRAERA